jgi:hypothetical protein
MNATVLVLMLVVTHGAISVLLLTLQKRLVMFYWFYLPSFLIAWIGYIAYEGVYIPRNCTGECNIRVDLLLIYPYLAFVSICTIAYFVLSRRAQRRRESQVGKNTER